MDGTTKNTIFSQKHNSITWVDVDSPDSTLLLTLENDYKLHPLHLKESIQRVQHIQVEREEKYLFLVLHYPIYDSTEDKIHFGQVGVFLGKDFLITIRTAISPIISGLFDSCTKNQTQVDQYFGKGSAYLTYSLIKDLLDDIFRMTEKVELELDEIEDLVFDNNLSDAQRIGKVRQKIVRLRRVIGPKKVALHDLAEQISTFSNPSMYKYYSNNSKAANKLWEVIEEAKETVEIYKDADFTTSTEQTNQILAILTIIFTFTIPITIIGTLYGMNVPLPGGNETGAWTYLGSYTTLIVLITATVLLALAMYLYFKKKRWF